MKKSDAPEDPPRRRALVLLGWLCVPVLPVLAALARLIGHPEYYFDGETQIPATIGRELLHGHLGDALHYQIIVYQGSLLWDALLSAVAYAVFGDHLLAWHAVPLAYLAGLSVAGTLLLARTVGPHWAKLFPLLLATMPFFVKDGFVSGIGGHAPGTFYAVAGLAAASYSSGEGGKRRYAILAGLLLGFGTWYVRTVLLAIPAAVVLVGHRIIGRLLLGIGLLALPILLAWNVQALQRAGTHSAAQGTTAELARAVILNVQETPPERVDPIAKVLQATGPAVHTMLFAQPIRAGTLSQTHRPAAYPAGVAWAAAWTGGLLLLPFLLLAPAVRRRPELVRGSLALFALGAAYVAAYALSPLNLDPGIVESLRSYPPLPPGVSGGRYLVPIQGILTLTFAQALGTLAAVVGSWPTLGIGAGVVILGALPALGDWRYDRDPADLWHHMPPHQYSGAFEPGRGPPLEVHLACDDPDPESREAHIEAIGRFLTAEARQSHDSASVVDAIERIEAGGTHSEEEIGRLVAGLGGNLVREFLGGGLSSAEMMSRAFETAAGLGPQQGENYLMGLRRSLRDVDLQGVPADLVSMLCRPSAKGTRPLCALAGERLTAVSPSAWPPEPHGLFAPGMPRFADLDRNTRDALLFGAAVTLTRTAPHLVLSPGGPAGWDPEDARVFVQKWRVKGGRVAR